MIQALLHARKKSFGPSTEISKNLDGQLSLFDTAQKLAEELTNEQNKITVPAYTRKARQPGVRAEMLSGLVQEIEEYIIPETDTCCKCGSKLEIIGKRIVRTEVEFVPAKLKVKQIVQQVAKCSKCGTDESEYDNCHFQKASVPVPLLAHSISTPSLIAQVMYQKFVMGMPFARQERDWYRLVLVLSRADMANWSIRCCEEWLQPVYNRIQCHKEEGRPRILHVGHQADGNSCCRCRQMLFLSATMERGRQTVYEAFFEMGHTPFTRDIPLELLYESPYVADAIGRLTYAADRQLIAVVTADAGCGKSTLIRRFVDSLSKDSYIFLYLSDSKLTPRWFYKGLLGQLGIESKF